MKANLLIVAVGTVIKSNGGQLLHGQILCDTGLTLSEHDKNILSDCLSCANLALVTSDEYEKEWKN